LAHVHLTALQPIIGLQNTQISRCDQKMLPLLTRQHSGWAQLLRLAIVQTFFVIICRAVRQESETSNSYQYEKCGGEECVPPLATHPEFCLPASLWGLNRKGKVYGRGAFGQVRKAYHLEKKKCTDVAVKIVDLALGRSFVPESDILLAQSDVIAEFKLQKSLNHTNILKVYETGQTQGPLWKWEEQAIFMEAAVGDLTSLRLSSYGQAKDYMLQMSDALQYMHGRDVVHMDIKFQNTLLSPNYETKLADFGFATQGREQNEKSTWPRGTPLYAAPEVLDGSISTFNAYPADVFSLGVSFLRMLTGCFLIDEDVQHYFGHLKISWKPMADLICAMLEHEPKRRPTMVEVYDNLTSTRMMPPIVPLKTRASSLLQELDETSSKLDHLERQEQAMSNLHLHSLPDRQQLHCEHV